MQWKTLKKNDPQFLELLSGPVREHMIGSRWYGGKTSSDKSLFADHLLPFDFEGERYFFLMIEVLYHEGFVHNYMLPLARARKTAVDHKKAIICELPGSKLHLVDALYLPKFREGLFRAMRNEKTLQLGDGYFSFDRGTIFRKVRPEDPVQSRVLDVEQSNTSVIYNDQFIFKVFRRLFRDHNPDIEMVQFLSERARFRNVPAFAASITWKRKGLYDVSIGMMQEKIDNDGDAWNWMRGRLQGVFQNIIDKKITINQIPKVKLFSTRNIASIPANTLAIMDPVLLKGVRQMGIRTAEMHIKLSEEPMLRLFTRQTYNNDYAVWLINRINHQFEARYALLDRSMGKLDGMALEYAKYFQENKTKIKNRIYGFDENELTGLRIRIHGDYHLGQLLVTGDDFFILDFEGEPESTVHDRKVKQSPLKDVSGMFRSFNYAIYSTIFAMEGLTKQQTDDLFEIAERLYHWMIAIFLSNYLRLAYSSKLNIGYKAEIEYLLKYHLLDKAIYELGYELNARPDWAVIPLRGIYTILNDKRKANG